MILVSIDVLNNVSCISVVECILRRGWLAQTTTSNQVGPVLGLLYPWVHTYMHFLCKENPKLSLP